MKRITVLEFKKLSGLSDRALVTLLTANRLPCSVDPSLGLMIDIDAVHSGTILQGTITPSIDTLESDRQVIRERFSRIIADNLDSITDEALSLYLSKRGS